MENSPVFHGSLEEKRIPEILYHLSRNKETGTLLLNHQSLEKSLVIEEGKIVFAASNDADDRLGAVLLRKNKISYQQLEEASPKVEPGKRLGTVLVLQGILQPNELYHAVVDQLKEIIFSVFDWGMGTYDFRFGPALHKEVITVNASTPDLILSGMQRIRRWSWIRQALPSMETVYRKKEGWSPVIRKMTLNREIEALVDLFDRPRTLDEALKISTLGNFETCRLIWIFLTLGVIEEILVAPQWVSESGETTARFQPSPDEQDLPATPAEAAVPTMKIMATEPPAEAATATANQLEGLLPEPDPFPELSFSDLSELADAEPERPAAVPPAESPVEPWESFIPSRLEDFNEIHRYLYEMIGLELGSGANSFHSKVFRKASAKYPLVFEGVGMNEFGELEESSLSSNIQANLVQDYSKALDFLISEERSMISLFLELKRVEVIESGLKRILNRHTRAAH